MNENMLNRIPLRIYRRLRWEHAQRPVYQTNFKNQGKEFADACYNVDKALYLNRPIEEVLRLADKRDQYILDYVKATCSSVIQKYQNNYEYHAPSTSETRNIWVFWWTGEDSAPELIKACLKSIRRNSNGHPVILLDQNNLHQYVHLPEYILEKHDQAVISHAHFSDIVRNTLLAEYGGIWIDSTVFLSQPLPDRLSSCNFFTAKSVDWKTSYYSHSRWVGFFLAGEKGFPLFTFVRDMLFEYWKNEDHVIDYLLMDYIFGIAYDIIPAVHTALDNLPNNNLLRGQLMREINSPYSPDLFSHLQTGETFFSKLSWRYGNPTAHDKAGCLTNYGHLLEL